MLEYSALDTKINRLGLPNRSKELRKYYSTILREVLPTEAIDLLEGRISSSMFARHYYKPFLSDIRNKVVKLIEPMQLELLHILENKTPQTTHSSIERNDSANLQVLE